MPSGKAARAPSGDQPRENLNLNATGSGTASVPSSAGAAANLKKAMNDQENDYKDVEEFLGSVGLLKYKDTFIDNGIEETEVILELNE